jgi:hypothetical protein
MSVPRLDTARPSDDAFDRLERSLIEVQQHLDDLIGMQLRDRCAERPGFFWDLVANPTAMTIRELNDLLQRAEDDGRLTHADACRVLWADIVIRGGDSDAPVYLLVKVSRKVAGDDVRRAVRRAAILRKAGFDARPVVAGERIRRSALDLAERLGVGRMFECEFDGEDSVIDDDAI